MSFCQNNPDPDCLKNYRQGLDFVNQLGSQGLAFLHGMKDAGLSQMQDRSDLKDLIDEIRGVVFKVFKDVVKEASGATEDIAQGAKKIMADPFTKAGIEIGVDISRGYVLQILPWMVVGLATMTAVPYAVDYIYRKAVHDIGKPKLAQKQRFVNWYDKIGRGILEAADVAKKAVIPGVLAGAGILYVGAASTIALPALNLLYPSFTFGLEPANELRSEIQCYMDPDCYRRSSSSDFGHLNALAMTALAIGGSVALATGAYAVYQKVKREFSGEPLPVFNKELTQTVDDIAKSTYNLSKHGGYFQNLLLYGPAGTGKTMLSEALAKNSNMNYVMMSGGDLAQYIKRGEHVTELNRLFESVKRSPHPTVLFIDEAESLCRDRDHVEKGEMLELLNAFLNHTGTPSNKFMVILTTNRMEDLDPAVLSRMDHKVFVGPPGLPERKKIIENCLLQFFSKKEREEMFAGNIVDEIAQKTEGFTGRTLFKMVNAMVGMKHASAKNQLTPEMVSKVVDRFIQQEALAEKMRDDKRRALESRGMLPLELSTAATQYLKTRNKKIEAKEAAKAQKAKQQRSFLPVWPKKADASKVPEKTPEMLLSRIESVRKEQTESKPVEVSGRPIQPWRFTLPMLF